MTKSPLLVRQICLLLSVLQICQSAPSFINAVLFIPVIFSAVIFMFYSISVGFHCLNLDIFSWHSSFQMKLYLGNFLIEGKVTFRKGSRELVCQGSILIYLSLAKAFWVMLNEIHFFACSYTLTLWLPVCFLSWGRAKKADINISTVGVDVCDWIYPKKTDFAFGRADNRPSIKFSTWDFGGQVRVRRRLAHM